MFTNKLFNKTLLYFVLLPFVFLWSCGESGSKADKDLYCFGLLSTSSKIIKSTLGNYRGQAYSQMNQLQNHLFVNGQNLARRVYDKKDNKEFVKATKPGIDWAKKHISKNPTLIMEKGSKQFKEVMRCLERTQLK
jgi:hypothetical protein